MRHWLWIFLFSLALPAAAQHYGQAPVDPLEADDNLFVVDRGGDLDTGCVYKTVSKKSLFFEIKVDRYVGPTKLDGTLVDVQKLIENQVISPKARLILPAADVDDKVKPVPPVYPEIDKVFFNGHEIGMLTGIDAIWVMNELEIPIELVRFPAERGAPGQKPLARTNQIRIDLDTANEKPTWGLGIDWAALHFRAMAPVLFFHGIAGRPSTWDGMKFYLTTRYVPYETDIQLPPSGSVYDNGKLVSANVTRLAKSFGANKVHIVAHSKGGLDTRRFLALDQLYNPFDNVRVLSLHTLSTPHHGSVHADISLAQRNYEDPRAFDPDLQAYMASDYLLTWAGFFGGTVPESPGLDNLTPGFMAQFNKMNWFPLDTVLYTYGADADGNNDGQISAEEAAPLVPNLGLVSGTLGSMMYRILRDTWSIKVTKVPILFGLSQWHLVTGNPTIGPLANDLSVTDVSSSAAPLDTHRHVPNRNHSNIKDFDSIRRIVETIRLDYPVY